MIAEYLIKGIMIGLIFGVPAGAIGALTIQRTIEKGFAAGFLTGAGSSAADLLYSAAGIFGITVISDFLVNWENVIKTAGGIVLIALGIMVWRRKKKAQEKENSAGTLVVCFLSAFGAAVMNPSTILSFMIAFTAFDITKTVGFENGAALMAGILTGTLCWWFALSAGVCMFRNKITDGIYIWLNRILGGFMTALGVVMIFK